MTTKVRKVTASSGRVGTSSQLRFCFFLKSSPEDTFIHFREKGKGGGERENINQLPPVCTLTGDRTHNLGMCLDWGSNLQPFGVRDDAPTN